MPMRTYDSHKPLRASCLVAHENVFNGIIKHKHLSQTYKVRALTRVVAFNPANLSRPHPF